MYDYLELNELALKTIADYATVDCAEITKKMSLWDDLAIEEHDLMMIVVDILTEVGIRMDINDERLSDLLEAETVRDFLQALYTLELD
jgi:acyl carrier protein